MELLVLLILILLFFGYKRLPQVGRTVGRGVREFKGELVREEAPEKRHPEAAREEEKAKSGPTQQDPRREQPHTESR